MAFLARHGRGHRISPSELNFRANIYGMKALGVERIISLSAVGSLQERHRPLDFVIPDQFFDRTRGRVSTFFGEGMVAHIGFADPICPELARVVGAACRAAGVNVTEGGDVLWIKGPAFSTKAESNVYRSWGMDVIAVSPCFHEQSGYWPRGHIGRLQRAGRQRAYPPGHHRPRGPRDRDPA